MGAYGAQQFGPLPYAPIGGGLRTPFGTIVPTGGLVSYVRSTGAADYDPPEITQRIFTTLNAALGQCRAGRPDVVAVLPGHAENISSADQMSNLVAGTKIIGVGMRPSATFTWTVDVATFLLDQADVAIDNLILNMDPGTGTTTIAAPMTVTGARCSITNSVIRMSTDANSLSTVPLTLSSSTDFTFAGNLMYGATAGEVTTGIDIVAADRLYMEGNHIAGACSSTGVGIVRFKTTASLHITMRSNFYANRKAASTMAVTGLAGVSGFSHNELFHYLDNTTTTMWGTSPGIMAFFNPRTVNLAGEAGMLSTVVST